MLTSAWLAEVQYIEVTVAVYGQLIGLEPPRGYSTGSQYGRFMLITATPERPKSANSSLRHYV